MASLTGMSRSGSDPRFVLVSNPGSRRTELFQAALTASTARRAHVVPWGDLLTGAVDLSEVVCAGDVVRIESPGKDFEVERLLLMLGAEGAAEEEWEGAEAGEVRKLSYDRGRILWPRQWYLGFCRALHRIEAQLAASTEYRVMNAPRAIISMFDKPLCQELLASAGCQVPRQLGIISGFEDLKERMGRSGISRVFVKLAHGSSASGVVAYQTNGSRHRASTTVEVEDVSGQTALYNTRRIRHLTDKQEIGLVIDAICRHRAYAEEWLPKAGLEGRTFDLRVLVVAGRACHTVVRGSFNPMTNLHLLNTRGDVDLLKERLGSAAWEEVQRTCEKAVGCFDDALYAGVDLLIAPDFRRHAVAEVNAFGDLLPGCHWNGMDPYETEIACGLGTEAECVC